MRRGISSTVILIYTRPLRLNEADLQGTKSENSCMQGKNERSRDICSGTLSSARQRLRTDESVYRQSGPYTRQDPGTAPLDTWMHSYSCFQIPVEITWLYYFSTGHLLNICLFPCRAASQMDLESESRPPAQYVNPSEQQFCLACKRTLH